MPVATLIIGSHILVLDPSSAPWHFEFSSQIDVKVVGNSEAHAVEAQGRFVCLIFVKCFNKSYSITVSALGERHLTDDRADILTFSTVFLSGHELCLHVVLCLCFFALLNSHQFPKQ